MYNKNPDQLVTHLTNKLSKGHIRVTTRLKGVNKKYFLEDCLKRQIHETALAEHIIDVYYSVMSASPGLINNRNNEIKNFIIERIKL